MAVAERAGSTAKLYVILGSHACRTAMLELEHKGLDFEVVKLPTGLHPTALRLAGFAGSREPRDVDGRRGPLLAMADSLGTVPALRVGPTRVQTNREIRRYLDELRPTPPLLPVEPARARQVEEIERWGDESLQMVARRVALAAGISGRLRGDGADGRLGPLLFHSDALRRAAVRPFSLVFSTGTHDEDRLLRSATEGLDTVDGWVEQGLLNGAELHAGDFMIAPSVALLHYHLDLQDEIERRPAGRLMERLLPAT